MRGTSLYGRKIRIYTDDDGLLVRRSRLNQSEQVLVFMSLKERVILLHHKLRVAGHPGDRRVYATIRRRFYRPNIAADGYRLVQECGSCGKERISLLRSISRLNLMPATAPPESLAIDISVPRQATSRGYCYILVICDQFKKCKRKFLMATTDDFDVARTFFTHCMFVPGPPVSVISDKGSNFT